jgi:phospholipid/cholesterol/gamma-HCH transport system ATP-binding protein
VNTNGFAIRFENVSKAFGTKPVLQDVSFEIRKGQALCILGRSGTGKSVTLKIAIGLLKPEHGKVYVEGADIAQLDRPELSEARKKMGFLFQNAALFDSISVAENLAFPLRRHIKQPEDKIQETVRQKLAQVGLEKDAGKMPSDLSGGMRKRVGLARALVLDPEILLIDEPSSGLDSITAGEIDHLLQDLKTSAHKTMVIVTHDVAGAKRFADQIAVLHDGRLIARGTSQELEQNENELVRELVSGERR